jgi:hypothetical protein
MEGMRLVKQLVSLLIRRLFKKLTPANIADAEVNQSSLLGYSESPNTQQINEKNMNKTILELIDKTPKDGTHPYFWVAGRYDGSTEHVYHNGMKIMTADPRGTYCCGITFELFLKALAKHDIIYPYSEIMEMQRAFFITQPLKDKPLYENKGMAGLKQGKEIKEADALAGDFCQLWRSNGSGHSVIFIEHIKRADNIIGMRYFSTQKKSNGVGYNEEYYNNVANPIHKAYFWRYGDLET